MLRSKLRSLLAWRARTAPVVTDRQPRIDLTTAERRIVEEASPYSMVSTERMLANMDAVAHVVRSGVPGAIVECGVWRGGSAMAMIRTLQSLDIAERDVYLFDTFEGMTAPTAADTSRFSKDALASWRQAKSEGRKPWDTWFRPEVFSLEKVEEIISGTGYPRDQIHIVKGRVEETIPAHAPQEIAVLRLDTDWYESTKHELEHLYPRLAPGGALIIDDYGHWEGCRRAVDEYFDEIGEHLLLTRIDYTGRIAVKR